MNKLVTWGNELYTGKRSYPFTSKHRLWFAIAGALVILSILIPVVKGRLQPRYRFPWRFRIYRFGRAEH